MIRLTKAEEPNILKQKSTEWTDALMAYFQKGQSPTDTTQDRYRHEDIKAAILEETKGKCAYCESKIRHIAHGDIEHIIPKSKKPEKSFLWKNLTLACDKCNENKSNHLSDHDNMVDPYDVDPLDHFFIQGPMVLPIPKDPAALLTEAVIKLNRGELVERRGEKILSLMKHVQMIAMTDDQATRELLKWDLSVNETSTDKEYTAIAMKFAREALIELEKIEMRGGGPKIFKTD